MYHKYSENTHDGYASRGEKTENNFISELIKLGYNCRKATTNENIREHNDLYIGKFGCDVKDRKSTAIFIELEQNGKPGWIKSEHTTYISFYLSDLNQYYICLREDILKLYNSKNYRTCGRKQYNEKLFVLPLTDLKTITRKII